jgi:hypothetical protein
MHAMNVGYGVFLFVWIFNFEIIIDSQKMASKSIAEMFCVPFAQSTPDVYILHN